MPLTTDKFILPDGTPANGKQAMKSSALGPDDLVGFETRTTSGTVSKPTTLVNPTAGNITITLNSGAEWIGRYQTVQRVANGDSIVTITSVDPINGLSSDFILSNMNDVASFFFDGTGFFVTSKLTEAVAALGLTTPVVASITTSFVKYDIFDTNAVSTPGRLTANEAASEVQVLQHGGGGQEIYLVSANIVFDTGANEVLEAQVFVNGVAAPGTFFSQAGIGAGDPTALIISQFVAVPATGQIDVRLRGTSAIPSINITSASFVVTRLRG